MDRRNFLKATMTAIGAAGCGCAASVYANPAKFRFNHDYFRKMAAFEKDHPSDIFLNRRERRVLDQALARLHRLQATVGHGNFQVLSFDTALNIARRYPKVERFTSRELDLIERLFYDDVTRYGFYGEKVITRLTDDLPKKDVVKVKGSGNYLRKGDPHQIYRKLRRVVGNELVLTSGVRAIVKQSYLFMKKAKATDGNLSKASRSLAPPGYSFHAVGDFDVGKKGFGLRNFTDDFAETDVFKRLTDLGYVEIRYPNGNLSGVRFEPWHIKVASRSG